jgi:tRNA pseudouridine13 synthase
VKHFSIQTCPNGVERFTINLFRVKPNFITYAGTKDRRAMTSQMMSVFKIDPVKLANLSKDLKGVTLGNYSYKPTCLKLGDLKGNRFRISLR